MPHVICINILRTQKTFNYHEFNGLLKLRLGEDPDPERFHLLYYFQILILYSFQLQQEFQHFN